LPSKNWKKNIRADKRALKTGILSSNLKIFNYFFAFSPSQLILLYVFLTQYAVCQVKKRISIKNLEKNYQGRQASAKSRNLLFKFKDFHLFFAGFFEYFFNSICCLVTKKENCYKKLGKQLSGPTNERKKQESYLQI
jgi:hypothetical protein